MAAPVAIPGLAGLRRDLRALGKEAPKALRKAEATAAGLIAESARGKAPRGTKPLPANRKKRLGDTIRPFVAGDKVSVGVNFAQAPHANVNHWGGTIRPRGVPIVFERRPFVLLAFDEHRGRFVDLLGDEITNLAARTGWH